MADLTVTPANVFPSTASSPQSGILAAGVTVTAGQTVSINASYQLTLADSDGAALTSTVAGIATIGGSPGQRISYVGKDTNFAHGLTGVVAGDILIQSDTPGGITKTFGDLETGDAVTVLGVATSATAMNLNITKGGMI